VSKEILACTVNGDKQSSLIDPRDTLLEFLRDRLGLTGTKEGCSNGNCGSCTVIVDGQTLCSCLMFAAEAQECEITTVEGLATVEGFHEVQDALVRHGGTQCGFCTPGVLMSAVGLFNENPNPNEDEIRLAIAGNICRCTGYEKIVKALQDVTANGEVA
jgi:aerobic carbon-monoxide dehydrogenase small subunit